MRNLAGSTRLQALAGGVAIAFSTVAFLPKRSFVPFIERPHFLLFGKPGLQRHLIAHLIPHKGGLRRVPECPERESLGDRLSSTYREETFLS